MRHMYIPCTAEEEILFKQISDAASDSGMPCYIVGGFVRDKILGRPTKDIDMVCVGSGIDLAHAVAKSLKPKPKVNYFKNFGNK